MKKVELILQSLFVIISGIGAITHPNIVTSIIFLITSILASVLVGYGLSEIKESEDTE